MNLLVGKTVTAVHLAKDDGAIRFDVEGAEPIIARADGDCCSYTWIENVEAPERLIGTPIVSVEDIDMPTLPYDKEKHECLMFYGCKIVTNKGECVIDYRNDSNGYYGGSLEWPSEDCYSHGGVYSQNVSKGQWKKIA